MKILLVFVSMLGAVCIGEILVRVLPLETSFSKYDLKWEHWRLCKAGGADFYTDKLSYHPDIGYEKPEAYKEIQRILSENKDSFKILFLGDSVTHWGAYVEYFEKLAKGDYQDGSIEMVNAGTMGYDMSLVYRYLKFRGLKLQPDLAVIQFNPNDFVSTPVIIKENDSWFAYDRREIHRFLSPFLFSRSKLYRTIFLRAMAYSGLHDDYKNNVKEPLKNIKSLLGKHGIPFYVLYFPPLVEEKPDWAEKFHRYFYEIVYEIDLWPHLIELVKEHPVSSLEGISYDIYHLNDKGHRIAAEVLFRRLSPFLASEIKNKDKFKGKGK